MAARRWPSRVLVGRPAVSKGIVRALPTGLPETSIRIAARCPALRSTASTPLPASSTRDGTVCLGSFHEATTYQRRRSGS